MKSLFNKQIFFEVLVLLIIGLTPLLWYQPGRVALGHDMGFPLAPVDYFQDRLFAWTDRVATFGSNQTDSISGVFIHGLEALFVFLGLALVNAQQLSFIFWFTLPGITMYILLRSLHPEKEDAIIRVSGSLFYMLNHYLLQGWTIAERTKFSIVAALPIVILVIINVIYKKQSVLKNSLILSLTLFFLNGGAGIPLWGGLFIASVTCLIVAFIFSEDNFFNKLKRTVSFVLLSLMMIGMLNMYWVYPYIQSFTQNYTQRVGASGGAEGAITWSGEISRNASLINLIKLQGVPDWYGNEEHPYANNFLNNGLLILLALMFPIIAFLGISKRNEPKDSRVYKIMFIALLIVAIPFTAGSHPPTGQIYDFLLKNLPGFSIFRTPFYKFGMVLWFAYAYLIAIGLKTLVELIHKEISDKISLQKLSLAVLATYIILLSIYNYPFFNGVFFNWSKKYSTMVKVPDYIFEAKKELDSNLFSTRTLMIPNLNDVTKYVTYDWKYFSLSTIPSMLSRRPVVINDATLIGNEGTLISGMYDQLRFNGESELLTYMGADRIIVQNDFNEPGSLNYNSSQLNSQILKNNQFVAGKTIGQWQFLEIKENEYKPLFYAPENLTYILSEPGHFKYVLNIPQLPVLEDALLFSEIRFPAVVADNVMNNFVSQSVIEGVCLNCDFREDLIGARPPKILPGNKLYFIIRFLEDRKLASITNVSQKIDFVVGTLAKNSAALKILVGDSKNKDTVISIVEDWNEKLKQLETYYMVIDDPTVKKENSHKIYRYLWFLIIGSQEWRSSSDSGEVVGKLIQFEDNARKLITDLMLEPAPVLIDKNQEIKQYQIDIPKNGEYQINMYSPRGFTADDKKPQNTILLDNQQVDFSLVESSPNWYQSKQLNLSAKNYRISFKSTVTEKTVLSEFNLDAKEASTQCRDINLGSVDPIIQYPIEFQYEDTSGRPLRFDLYERSDEFVNGKFREIGKLTEKVSSNPNIYKTRFVYIPNDSAKSAFLRFCLDGNYSAPSTSKISAINLDKIYSPPIVLVSSIGNSQQKEANSPNIEFVALNQTKYLVKVTGAPSEYILNFNSRFDKQWKIREVDGVEANRYFTGQTKKYLNGKVIEYQRQDNHILTDYIFPREGDKTEPNISLNTMSNGWVIEDDSPDKEKVYLVEYEHQNIIYKTIAVSIITFLILSVILFIKVKYGKNN